MKCSKEQKVIRHQMQKTNKIEQDVCTLDMWWHVTHVYTSALPVHLRPVVSSRREVALGLRLLKWCAFIPKCTRRGDGASCRVHLIHLVQLVQRTAKRPTQPMQMQMQRVAFVDLSMLCRKELLKLRRSLWTRRVSSSSAKNCEILWSLFILLILWSATIWKLQWNCYVEIVETCWDHWVPSCCHQPLGLKMREGELESSASPWVARNKTILCPPQLLTSSRLQVCWLFWLFWFIFWENC